MASPAKIDSRRAAEYLRLIHRVDPPRTGGDDGGIPPDLAARVDRLESDMRLVREALGRLEPKMDRLVGFIDSGAPHLATRAEVAATKGEILEKLADKPGKSYLWMVLAVLVAAVLGGAALLK